MPRARASSSRSRAGRARAGSRPPTATRSAFDPRIVEDYDLVFLDQRGVGASRALQCPDAALAFYSFPGDPAHTRSAGVAYAAAAKRFARDCVAQARVPAAPAPVLLDAPGGRGPGGVPFLARRAAASTCTARATGPSTCRRTRPRTPTACTRSSSTARSTSRSPARSTTRSRHGPSTRSSSMTLDTCSHDAGVPVRRPRAATRWPATTPSPGSCGAPRARTRS